MKDNHIFKDLATLSTYGTTLKEAQAAGKEVRAAGRQSVLGRRFRLRLAKGTLQ